MSRWTPTDEGWVTRLGAGWHVSYWQGRKGPTFRAEAHARALLHEKDDELFAKITLLECMARANDEQIGRCEENKFDENFTWSSLLNAQRFLLAEKATKKDFYRGPSKGDLDEEFPSQIRDYMARKDVPGKDKDIKFETDGSITIPACATSALKDCKKMLSFGGGAQLFLEKQRSSATYRMPRK